MNIEMIGHRKQISGLATFVRYVVFALIAGAANLIAQFASAKVAPIYPIQMSMLFGTGVGFFVKYILDKQWVFFDPYSTHGRELGKIVLYGLSGVGTTLLFWGFELSFWYVWDTNEARYVGAAIGLSLGNLVKYLLDRTYVFGQPAEASLGK